MGSLIFVFTTLILLVGFVALTWYETAHGVRFFAPQRASLDQTIGRIEFIVDNVDLVAFLRDEARHFARRIGHDIVHFSLLLVRAVERLLTRLVRHFRSQQAVEEAPREEARAFVKTLAEFKDGLKATHPEVSDITAPTP